MSHFCARHFREPVYKAKPRKAKTKHYERTLALSRRMGNAVGMDLLKGLKRFRSRVSTDALRRAWESGNYSNVVREIPWEKLGPDMEPGLRGMRRSLGDAADLSALRLPPNVNERLRFDASNPLVDRYLSKRTGTMVVGIQRDTQDIVRAAVQRSFTHAITPADVADQIKGSIGLHPQYEQAVRNYERGLREGGAPESRVQALSSAYEDKLLDARAMAVGRTEVRNSTNFGQLAMWQEAANQDLIDRRTARKSWVVDGNPCPECDEMDGVTVALDEPWVMADGTVCEVPSEAHPNCECGMELEFDAAEENDASGPAGGEFPVSVEGDGDVGE